MMRLHASVRIALLSLGLALVTGTSAQEQSVVRQWNDQLLGAISRDFARPPIHARNLFHTSAAMYDAWAAYEPTAEPYLLGRIRGQYTCPFNGVPIPSDPIAKAAAQEQAISFAMYRILLQRFQNSPGFGITLPLLNDFMDQLGYDRTNTSVDYVSGGPAELGNYVAQEFIAFGFTDGSNQANNYANVHYTPSNPPIAVEQPGNPNMLDPNLWQQISLTNAIDQAGNPVSGTPAAIGHNWGEVVPFAMDPAEATMNERDSHPYPVFHDPGAPAQLDTTDASGLESFYKWNFILVSVWQSHLDPTDTTVWDISPGAIGNLPGYPDPQDWDGFRDFYNYFEGDANNIPGHDLNPATGLPYEPQLVKRGDYTRILAEYWADGPSSVTPPGHWFKIMHDAMDHPQFERRWMGQGDLLSTLDYDVKAHFVMGGSQHDAAMTAWSIKGWYDYVRPVSAIRYMAERGQCTDAQLPNYHPAGLPIIPGHVEQVVEGDPLAGANNEHVGKMKLYTWKGPEYIDDALVDFAGVDWILAEEWWPYQRPWFVTPPFAGYISGHSTYSSTAAQVMEMITGDPFFPGGMRVVHCPQDEFLQFEIGPSEDVYLQWATYRDASDQCSLSRIWGGIHPPMDDIAGRHIGIEVGTDAVDFGNSLLASERPVVVSVVASDDVVNIADIGSTLSVVIEYDRDMDPAFDVLVDFLVEDPMVEALALISASWTGDSQYTMEFEVLASDLRLEEIRMRIDQARSVEGRSQDVFLVAQPFVIDTDRPSVAMVESASALLNDALAQTGTLDVVIGFNEACDIDLTPAIAVTGTSDPSGSITYDATGSVWLDALTYRARFNVIDANEEIDQVSLAVSNVFDRAGNDQQVHGSTDFIVVDTRNPGLSDALVNDAMLGLQAVGNSALEITLEFDEAMNTALTPSLTFPGEDPTVNSLVLEPLNSTWINTNTYRFSYSLVNANEELFVISSALVDFNDEAGNSFVGAPLEGLFTVDTRRPVVQQTQPSVAVVSDSDAGVAGFQVDVLFPEAMDNTQLALVQLIGPGEVASTFTQNISASSWVAADTYRAVFNVADQNVEVENVGVEVSFARDLAGNTQTSHSGAAVFDLDTKNPALLVLTANTYTITNSNMGAGGFTLLSVFDEPMDESVVPVVVFSEPLVDVLTEDPTGSEWLNASTFNGSYGVANIQASVADIDVSVSGARDLAGNLVQVSSLESFFNIDLQEVGVEEVLNGADLTVFPNPLGTGQPLQLLAGKDLQDVDLTVFNTLGAIEHKVYLGHMARGVYTVDLPELATGVYHVRLSIGGVLHTRTLVVQNQ
jgi:hypothetical protein